MEVMVPVPASDFHFDSNPSTPYRSAPSTPTRIGQLSYFSAPTSPRSSALIYNEFNPMDNWEDKKPVDEPNSEEPEDDYNDADFQFEFSGQLERSSLTAAEELFEKGKIRLLKPSAPTSATKSGAKEATELKEERGRERSVYSSSNASRRGARSVSPIRVSDFGFEALNQQEQKASSSPKAYLSPFSNLKCSRKWKLKDLLLFRSASEGHGTTKEVLRKYGVLPRKGENVKNSSFRTTTTDGGGSVSGSSRGRRGPVSAHELHYTKNRAVSEEMRRKTFLPYKQGLLGCLGFNPTVHGLAKGFRSITHG